MDLNSRRLRSGRREAIKFLLGGIGALSLVSCTDGQDSEPIVLDSFYDSGEGRQAMLDAVRETSLASSVQIGTTSRGTFSSSIDGYLASRPGSVFTWTTGAIFAELLRTGQVDHVSDVWSASDLDPRLRRMCSDASGVQFMVPLWYDPIAFFYSRTEWADSGFTAPSTPSELLELSSVMAANGIAAFGMARLATPALISVFDYLSLSVHGVETYREAITTPSADVAALGAEVFPIIQTLADIESGLDTTSPVSIVPARLSEAAERSGSDDDLGCFVLEGSTMVADCEGLMLALGPEGQSQQPAKELLGEMAEIDTQTAFLGAESARLPANLNADYQSMGATMLRVVEKIDASTNIVESMGSSSPETLAQLTNQLMTIARP